jgi:hypothetical protein
LFDEAFVLNSTMKRIFFILSLYFFFFAILLFANKVSGIVVDKADQPVPLQIAFKDSNEGGC